MTLTGAKRKYVVKNARVRQEKRGDIGYWKDAFKDGEEPDVAWKVTLEVRHGLLPESFLYKFFKTERDAKEYLAQNPIGSELPHSANSELAKAFPFDEWVKLGFFPIEAGSPESFMVFETLKNAGITDSVGLKTSQFVLDTLGEERVATLQEIHGENWAAVAHFQYCFENLPHSSPAYVAAAVDFCHYILEDDFKAGYLLRDLEVLLRGVEDTAVKKIETGQKAGLGGGESSKQARKSRRTELFEAISTLVTRNPDIVKFGENELAKLAVGECAKNNPSMWKQGRGQALEYIGEIRRGEAGEDMQRQYLNMFGSKPPKR